MQADIPRFLPWQTTLAQTWLQSRERFAHAWLIHGMAGIGKRHFARAAAASLLCDTPQHGLACGACQACLWVAKGSHPDLRLIRPDAVAQQEGDIPEAETTAASAHKTPSNTIRVEQLRVLHDWFNTATHRGGWRVIVLYPAESLNVISANALLKVLEEPAEHTVFLVVADAPDRLLPTLVSRCRRLPLPMPDRQVALAWLQSHQVPDAEAWLAAQGGAPVHAQSLAQAGQAVLPDWLQQWVQAMARPGGADLMGLAEQLETLSPTVWLDTLQRFMMDFLLLSASLPPRYYPALAAVAQPLAQHAQADVVADRVKWLAEQSALAEHPLNARLFAHHVLQHLTQACRSAKRSS